MFDGVISRLASLLPRERLLTHVEQLAAYESDGLTAFRTRPLAVVVAESAEEVIRLVRFCHEHKLPFVKRTDARFEYNGQIEWWRPGMKLLGCWEFTNTEATEIFISLDALKRALNKHKSLRKVISGMEMIAPDPGPITLLSKVSRSASPI